MQQEDTFTEWSVDGEPVVAVVETEFVPQKG